MTDQGRTGSSGQAGEPGQGWAAGLRFGDRYLVERLIGEGGWAETYRGRDLLLGRPVALKLLRSQFAADPSLVDRFEREARIAAAISHPNVVAVYDFGTQDGIFFIALQFIAGEDLKHVVVRRGRLPVDEAVVVTREILLGLGAIHRAGIVHRDVKPQNVLVGEDGIVRITDFGIAHQSLATRVTTHGDAMGTASYMAPEQARGEDVSSATDVYSLGVMLYELLTGRLPFEREHAMATLLAHLQEPPPPPRAMAPDADIPPWLEAIVLRAMAKRPEDRFSSAPAMLAALAAGGRNLASEATTGRFLRAADPVGDSTRVVPGVHGPGLGMFGPATEARTVPAGMAGLPPARSVRGRGTSAPSRRGWGVVVGVVLAALLVIGGVAAASMWDDGWLGAGDGDSPTATVRTLPALATPTATGPAAAESAADEPTATARATATATATANATATATTPTEPTETMVPASTPTETPEATSTPPPTDVPTSVPTAIPTEPPPTATSAPEPPTQTPVPVVEEPPIESDTGGSGIGAAESPFGPILLSGEDWWGGAGRKTDDTPRGNGGGGSDRVGSIEARSGSDGTAATTFTLDQVPGKGVTIELQARLEEPDDGPALLSIAVNDAGTSSPVDISTTGAAWGVVTIQVPAGALVTGENLITASALEVEGDGERPVILLGDVTVARLGVGGGEESGAGSGSDVVSEETPVPVDEDTDVDADTDGGNKAPTIAPV